MGLMKVNMDDGLNIEKLMDSARRLQQGIARAKEDMGTLTAEGTAGGGAVRATVSNTSALEKLVISPAVANHGNVQGIAQLVVSAVSNA